MPSASETVPERDEIDDAHTWTLDAIFAADEEWEAAYAAIDDRLDDLRAYEGRLTEDAETLAAVLETREEIFRELSTVSAYARMRRDEDTRKGHYRELASRAQALGARASSAASFIEPELQANPDRVRELLDASDDLATYEHYVDDVLRMAPHTRDPEIEALLADLSEVTGAAGEVYDALTNADLTFPAVDPGAGSAAMKSADGPTATVDTPDGGDGVGSDADSIEITLNNFTKLQRRDDRDFRRRVYEAFYDRWADVRHAVATAYDKSVRANVRMAEVRDYDSALEASLDGPNIPVGVYDALLETVRGRLDPLHRHVELKRDRHDLDAFRMWDCYVPLAADDPEVAYDEAVDHVTSALAPLGDNYVEQVAEGVESGWIDVYETRGKQSGAYSGGTYDTDPYVLMNYQDDVRSMYTLAHELGHSMHSELTSEHQPYVYSGTAIFVAEVASTVNEALLTHHLLEHGSPELRRAALDHALESFRTTLYRQTMFADFEHATHERIEEGGALTPDALDELYAERKSEWYAPGETDDRIAREWMRIPHFYRAFYVYQYATGKSAAHALVDRLLAEGAPAREDYLRFLQRGSSAYPLELLDDAGVDLSSAAPVDAAIDAYEDRLDEAAATL
jgi:oligoendopeptidase F